MSKNQSFSLIKKIAFLIGFSTLLVGVETSFSTPKSLANPGFFEYQWDPEPGYRKLKYYQSSDEKLERATYYLFLRGKERKGEL